MRDGEKRDEAVPDALDPWVGAERRAGEDVTALVEAEPKGPAEEELRDVAGVDAVLVGGCRRGRALVTISNRRPARARARP